MLDLWILKKMISLRDQEPVLTTWELLCSRVLLNYKKDRESFWHRHWKGDEECPTEFYQGLIYFYQTHSHNIHLKLTRLKLAIERSYQTHSYSISLKIRLVRSFLLRKRNMSSSKVYCCYIIIGTEFKEKQDELFCCIIINSGLKETTTTTTFYVTKMQECRKKMCTFLLLKSPRPLSPPHRPQTSYQPT